MPGQWPICFVLISGTSIVAETNAVLVSSSGCHDPESCNANE
jgi:hypothetical protein